LTVQDNESKHFLYDLNNTVDITEFVQYISESDNLIVCTPQCFDDFKEKFNEADHEVMKLAEYIYKIINSFNESFNLVFSENIE
jgi:hypothetical protein